jgi:hypothetical protein
MGIKVTIKPGSKTAHAFKKYMADKAAFKQAVTSGNVTAYVKKSGKKFDTPISVSK